MPQQVDDFPGRHLLGIEQVVDAHFDKDLLVVGLQVFVVVNAGDGFLRSELLGEHGRHHVVVLDVVHGDEQVAPAHRRLAQHGERGRIALDGNHVGQAGHVGQELLVAVDDGDVVAVAAEHLGQVAAHLARTRYYDLHNRTELSAGPSASVRNLSSSPERKTAEPVCNLSYKCINLQANAQISDVKLL